MQHNNNTIIMRNDHSKWHTSRITLTHHFENVWCKQWHYDILSWFYCTIISYRWEEDSLMIVIVRYLHTENGMHMLMLMPSNKLKWLWKITMFHRYKYNYEHILTTDGHFQNVFFFFLGGVFNIDLTISDPQKP